MTEFRPVSRKRKNETNIPDFEVEKLEKPAEGASFEFFESKVGRILPEKPADPAAALDRLRVLYRGGRLAGLRLELPGRPPIYDLQAHLSRFHGRALTDADHAELEAVAALVVRLPFLEVN